MNEEDNVSLNLVNSLKEKIDYPTIKIEHRKDYFSESADDYAKYRPTYPHELYRYLAGLVYKHDWAWDCATGTGQSAVGIAPYFDRVIASDLSAQQIKHAAEHHVLQYCIMLAEASALKSNTINLITVSQAVHWFKFEDFYEEVKRILKSEGKLAVWCYGLPRINDRIDDVVDFLYGDILSDFWPKERRFIDEQYKTIPFPFNEIKPPSFKMETVWDFSHFSGYLNTWSAVQRYRNLVNADPFKIIENDLLQAWDDKRTKYHINWPLYLRIGVI